MLELTPNIFGPSTFPSRLARQFSFPGGERHVELPADEGLPVLVGSRLESSNDIMDLLLAADALRRRKRQRVSAYLPYIPYGRQDRVAIAGEPLSISVMADLINSCGFDEVFTVDPHSSVTSALVNNLTVMPMNWFLYDVVGRVKSSWKFYSGDSDIVFVAPDAGALKKVEGYAEFWREPRPVAVGIKHRNALSGEVRFVDVNGPVEGNIALIIDDICDGGASFIGLTKALLAKGATEVFLAVTHGIFSKGLAPLKDAGISKVFSTDTRIPVFGEHEPKKFLEQIPVWRHA